MWGAPTYPPPVSSNLTILDTWPHTQILIHGKEGICRHRQAQTLRHIVTSLLLEKVDTVARCGQDWADDTTAVQLCATWWNERASVFGKTAMLTLMRMWRWKTAVRRCRLGWYLYSDSIVGFMSSIMFKCLKSISFYPFHLLSVCSGHTSTH